MKTAIDSKAAQLLLVSFCLIAWLLAVFNRTDQTLVAVLCCATVVAWSWVNLYHVFHNLLIRRTLKFIPFFIPVVSFGFDFGGTVLGAVCAVGLAALYLWVTRRSIAKATNPALMALMPRADWNARWSESAFFTLSAIAQEYLHRFVLLRLLLDQLHTGVPIAVAITTLTFVGEHFTGPNGHTALSRGNILLWTGMGIVYGLIAALTGSYIAVMVGHVIINLPASVRPHLRGKSRRSVETV